MEQRDPYVSALVERFRALAAGRGFSLSEVERRMGKEESFLRQALTGRKRVTLEALVAAIRAIDVDPDDFFSNRYAPPPRHAQVSEPVVRYGDPQADELAQLIAERGSAAAVVALTRALIGAGVLTAEELAKVREGLAAPRGKT